MGIPTYQTILPEELATPSIEENEAQVGLEASWMGPIISYLKEGLFPYKIRRIIPRAARYSLINGELYKKSFTLPYLRYL